MAEGNYDIFAHGLSSLGAALSGVGGIEGYQQQQLVKLQEQARMAQLQEQFRLKQQAEEEKRKAIEAVVARHRMLGYGSQPAVGAQDNTSVIHAALQPGPLDESPSPSPGPGDTRSLLMDLLPEMNTTPGLVSMANAHEGHALQYELPGYENVVQDQLRDKWASQGFASQMSGAHSAGLEEERAVTAPSRSAAQVANRLEAERKAREGQAQEEYNASSSDVLPSSNEEALARYLFSGPGGSPALTQGEVDRASKSKALARRAAGPPPKPPSAPKESLDEKAARGRIQDAYKKVLQAQAKKDNSSGIQRALKTLDTLAPGVYTEPMPKEGWLYKTSPGLRLKTPSTGTAPNASQATSAPVDPQDAWKTATSGLR